MQRTARHVLPLVWDFLRACFKSVIKPDPFMSTEVMVQVHSEGHTWAVVVRRWAGHRRIPKLIRVFLSFRLWEAKRLEQVFRYC